MRVTHVGVDQLELTEVRDLSAVGDETLKRAALRAMHQDRLVPLDEPLVASLALAERRPDDLKAAVERLGQQAPSSRQLFALRVMGLIAPPAGSSPWLRVRGILIILAFIVAVLALGFAIVKLVALPFDGVGNVTAVWLGFLLVLVALIVLVLLGRRRQKRALAARGAPRAG